MTVKEALNRVTETGYRVPPIQRQYLGKDTLPVEILQNILTVRLPGGTMRLRVAADKEYGLGQIVLAEISNLNSTDKTAILKYSRTFDKLGLSKNMSHAVVDGQQRLTALKKALIGCSSGGTYVFDLLTLEVRRLRNGVHPENIRIVPLPAMYQNDPATLAALTEYDAANNTTYAEVFEIGHQRLTGDSTLFSVETNHVVDSFAMADLFSRINQGQRPVTSIDLYLSYFAALAPDVTEEIRKDEARYGQNFKEIESKRYLSRIIIALLFKKDGTTGKPDHKKGVTPESLKEAYKAAKQGLDAAIQFMKNKFGIPKGNLLESVQPLAIVALVAAQKIFTKKKFLHFSSVETTLLEKYVFNFILIRRHALSAQQALFNQDIKNVMEEKLEEMLDLIEEERTHQYSSLSTTYGDFDSITQSGRAFSILKHIYYYQKNIKIFFYDGEDRSSNTIANIIGMSTDAQEWQLHHQQPKNSLNNIPQVTVAMVESPLNKMFIPEATNNDISDKPLSAYVPIYCNDSEVAAMHLLSTSANELVPDNYLALLAKTEKLIRPAMNAFLANKL